MARIEDYATDRLDAEIDEAGEQQQARDSKGRFIPDRFKGKDIGDVIQSYEELEKMTSRQANELGNMKSTVDKLLEMQSPSPVQEPTAVPVTVDDIYDNPDAAMRRVAREESSGEITALREEVSQLRTERKFSELEDMFPKWQEQSASPEFQAWLNETPYRLRIGQVAAGGDFDAAEELLGMFYATQSEAEAQAGTDRNTNVDLRDVTLESSGPAPTELVDTYSRSELLEMRLASKRGDLKAERWLAAHAGSIAEAYAEGRIVN